MRDSKLTRILATIGLAGALALGGAACADDDGATDTTTTGGTTTGGATPSPATS